MQQRRGEPRSTSWPSWRQQVHALDMKSRVHPKYKIKYHVGNWPAYDQALVQRGDIIVWLAPDAVATWEAVGVGTRGGHGGARRGLCEGRRRGRIGRRNGDHRMIHKGTYGSSFRLRCYPFLEGKIVPERPQRRGGAVCNIGPPARGHKSTIGGGRSGLFVWPRAWHVSCKNLNNHRAKRGLWLQQQVE